MLVEVVSRSARLASMEDEAAEVVNFLAHVEANGSREPQLEM